MSTSADANHDAPYPYTGTLVYPVGDLLTMARSILQAQEERCMALLEAAEAANDEDEEVEQAENLHHTNRYVFALDGQRWRARVEEREPKQEWDVATLRHFEDPSASERALFTLNGPRAERAIGAAIQYRRDTRGAATGGDYPSWDREDGLLNLLHFFTRHNGLFALPLEDDN